MAFRGIQGKGVKGKSGRKTKLEEIKRALNDHKEKVTQEALIELANSKVFHFLQQAANIEEVRALGLPITLKGMTEKIDHTTQGEKIVNNDKIQELANILRNGNTSELRRFNIGSDGTSSFSMGGEVSNKE